MDYNVTIEVGGPGQQSSVAFDDGPNGYRSPGPGRDSNQASGAADTGQYPIRITQDPSSPLWLALEPTVALTMTRPGPRAPLPKATQHVEHGRIVSRVAEAELVADLARESEREQVAAPVASKVLLGVFGLLQNCLHK